MPSSEAPLETQEPGPSLRGCRVLLVAERGEQIVEESYQLITDALRERKALVGRIRPTGDDDVSPVRDAIRRFAPSAILCAGSVAGARAAKSMQLPTIHLASPAWTPNLVLDDAPAGVVLWFAPDVEERAACPLPSLAAGPLGAAALDELADLLRDVLEALRGREPARAVPEGALAVGRAEFQDFLESSSPPDVGPVDVAAFLDQAIQLGMPHFEIDHLDVFDRNASWNWLFQRSAAFYEPYARAYRRAREYAGLVAGARPSAACCSPGSVVRRRRYRVELEVELDQRDLDEGTRCRLYLPFPVPCETQSPARLVDASPESLGEALVAEFGYFYGADLVVDDRPTARVSYRADLVVGEVHYHLEPGPPTPPLRSARAMLQHVSGMPADPVQRAWAIYDWMMRVGRFEKVARSCICPECSAALFDRHKGGDCVLLAHAFLHYCRAVGVRARPARGALFDCPRDPWGRRFGNQLPGQPVVGHTWAEFQLADGRWAPVEFQAVCLKACSKANCTDPELRAALEQDYAMLRAFYFGNLDNQRVRYSESALTIPWAQYFDESRPLGSRWRAFDMRQMRFAHFVDRGPALESTGYARFPGEAGGTVRRSGADSRPCARCTLS